MRPVYASHASEAFNEHLDAILKHVTTEVHGALGNNLVALLLGGGYGRGEGGVVRNRGVEHPYNDLDLTLVVRRKRRVPQDVLKAIGKTCESRIGIEVDFSRPLTPGDIRSWPHQLMWFDLLNGHAVLYGPKDFLTMHAPETLYKPLPPIEATRLLLNRGAGLLWALRVVRGLEPLPDADFVRRNFYKCALALGDALLIAHGRFSTPYRGRDVLLAQLAASHRSEVCQSLVSLYRKALRFKFFPDDICGDMDETGLRDLAGRWGEIFLQVERLRTGQQWPSLSAYAAWRGIREPAEHGLDRWPRNCLQNLLCGTWSWRYPREALYWQLPVLLELTETPVCAWAEATQRFLTRWRRFN